MKDLIEKVQERTTTKTPYFLLSEDKIRENGKQFKELFGRITIEEGNKTKFYYSVKTNYEVEVLKILKDIGFGGEISGELDLFFALKAGMEGKDIIYDGPCKPDNDLIYAIKSNVNIFNLDSMTDAKNLKKIAKSLDLEHRVKVGFRVRPLLGSGYMSDLATGFAKKFGVPYEDARIYYLKLLNVKEFDVCSISTNIGSQILSPKHHIKALDKLCEIVRYLDNIGVKIEEINIGGGYPSPTLIKTTPLNLLLSKVGINREPKQADLDDFAREISQFFVKKINSLNLRTEPDLVFEPGRSIVSDAGVYICRVVDKKGNFLFIDGTNNHIPESLFFARREVFTLRESDNNRNYVVCGRTLNTADIISQRARLPTNIRIGDIVIVKDAGAYTITEAKQFTMMRPPVYMAYSNGKVKKIRREETPKDIERLMR